jgi:predicted O-linked N-acetylglucosamine transferase (SPINDLY family)
MHAEPVAAALGRLRAGDGAAALALLQDMPEATAPAARHAALGMVHLAAGRAAEALAALRAAAALGDTSPPTLLNLALAEDQAGDPARAGALMAGLRRDLPGWDEPALRLADRLRRAADPGAAAAYDTVLELNPKRLEALLARAALHLQAGHIRAGTPARAQMLLLRACGIAPEHAPAWDALGVALLLTGEADAAESAFARAQALAPDDAAIALRRGEASIAAGTAEAELARLEQAAISAPLDPVLLTARGALLMHLGRRDDAVEVLHAAVALAPDSQPARLALAHAMVAASRVGDAIPVLQQAVALAPDDAALRNNLAATLLRAHRHREAADLLRDLLAEHGDSLGVLCNLTNALVSLGLQQQGLETAEHAVALDPNAALAWRAMANALAYHPQTTAARLLAALRRIGTALPRLAPFVPTTPRDPERRLRVGLLSATLKTHPVGWLTIAGFETLDPAAFELVALGPAPTGDALQRRFRAVAAEWHAVDGEPVQRLVPRLRALDLDILIDLGGYGDRGMMGACASRVAPVQVKWVGAQNHSTGLAEMDWLLTDRWETPAGAEPDYTEKLLRLPDGYVCYSPPAYAPDVGPLPALARGAVTFGCFNNLAKITPVVLASWAAILHRVPGARLMLKAHQLADAPTRARLLDGFAAAGIAPDRIMLHGGSPHRDLLAAYNAIDIVLDPFPYSGGLTTCEALWMGVPTITMPGETFASRHSASHLGNVGLADWVAADLAAYQHMAVQRAADLPALARLRAGLRAQVKASPLCDAPRFGRSLGGALRRAWLEYCGRQ